jgi:thioesterase domain-containing protein
MALRLHTAGREVVSVTIIDANAPKREYAVTTTSFSRWS